MKNPKFKGFAGEITLKPDTTVELAHNQKSRRIRVTAVTAAGRRYPIKFLSLIHIWPRKYSVPVACVSKPRVPPN